MSKIKKSKREAVMEKCNGRCAYCGQKLTEFNATIDHVHPKIKGGTNAIENLLPACPKCNGSKSNMSIDEYRDWILNRINYVYNGFQKRKKIVFYFEKVNSVKSI